MNLKALLKAIAYSSPAQFGLGNRFLNRKLMKNALVGFLYHEVSDRPSPFHENYGLNVPPKTFEWQIKFIQDNFNVLTPDQLLSGHYDTPAACVTFDDGSYGYFQNALPILKKLNCPSILFANGGPAEGEIFWSGLVTYLFEKVPDFTAFLKSRNEYPDQVPAYLFVQPESVDAFLSQRPDADEIRRSAREFYGDFPGLEKFEETFNDGNAFLGNHLFNHYNAATLSNEGLKSQYLKNETFLKRFKNARPLFSYPFGHPHICFTKGTNETIRSLGAKALFSCVPQRFKPVGDFHSRFYITDFMTNARYLRFRLSLARLKQIFAPEPIL